MDIKCPLWFSRKPPHTHTHTHRCASGQSEVWAKQVHYMILVQISASTDESVNSLCERSWLHVKSHFPPVTFYVDPIETSHGSVTDRTCLLIASKYRQMSFAAVDAVLTASPSDFVYSILIQDVFRVCGLRTIIWHRPYRLFLPSFVVIQYS